MNKLSILPDINRQIKTLTHYHFSSEEKVIGRKSIWNGPRIQYLQPREWGPISPRLSGRRQNNVNLSYRKSRLLWSMDRTVCVSVWSWFANGLLDDVTMKLTFHIAIVPVLRCQAAWVTAPCFDHVIILRKKIV